jgi:hypothetical protein
MNTATAEVKLNYVMTLQYNHCQSVRKELAFLKNPLQVSFISSCQNMKQERITTVDEVPPVNIHYKAVHIATNSCGSVNFICLAEANRSATMETKSLTLKYQT